MAYPLPSDPRDANHRQCMRIEAANAHRIANGESLLQEAVGYLQETGGAPTLCARMKYFLENHKPMLRQDSPSGDQEKCRL